MRLAPQDNDVRQRVNFSTLLPIGFLGLAALVVLMQVNRVRETAEWVQHVEAGITACANVERIAREHKAAVLRGLSGIDTRDELLSARTRATEAILALEHHLADNEAQVHQVRELGARYRTWLGFTNSLRHQPGLMDATVRDIEQVKPAFEPIILALHELEREERRLRLRRGEEFVSAIRWTMYGTLPGLALIVIVAGLFHRSQMLRLAKDFGEALEGQEAARASVAQQNWVREQLALLVGTTRDDPGIGALGIKILTCIAESTGAVLGAFYVWDEVERRWSRHAKHGLPNGVSLSFGEGEGLVGQAGRKTTMTVVRGIEDEFFFAQAGTGQGPAGELRFIPCHHDGQVLGIVELGFFAPPSESAEKLMEQCGEALGIAVSVTKKRLLQRELLMESKRQAEALQAQQEELRVTNEELASQSEALRAAHAQLEERKEELEASNADLVRQRDVVSAAREDLATRALELRRANRYKSEFLASMSHELRTPLNSCLILSRSLADNKTGNLTEEQVKFAETIYASGTDLLELINTVLDLSKIEAGAIELVVEETTLKNLVKPVARVMEPIAAERKLQFIVEMDEGEALLETDVIRVQQVLKNLLSNACKFTAVGSVTLHAQVTEEECIFTVKDTGIGIAEDQLESIFEAFRQADGTASRRFGGTGLGLTISRDLAKRLGGDIRVHSLPGSGSEFVLVIPRYKSDTALAQTVAAQLDAERKAPPGVAVSEPKREVLVVGRDTGVSAEVDRIIESWGFDVVHVPDNAAAVVHLGEQGVAAVIAQSGDGLDELREQSSRRDVPFHVLDSSGQQDRLSRGVLRHLRKPVDEGELRRALNALFDNGSDSDGVLLVEDDDAFRESLEVLLQENRVRVTSTATVDGALKALQSSTFACIILDLQLADGRGEDLLRTISNNDEYSFPHVIVYTGETLSPAQEQELLRFSDAVILKGVRSEERLLDELSLFLYDVNGQSQPNSTRDKRAPEGGGASLRNRCVLLVEDDVRNVYALTSVLEREGVKVEVARNGKESLTKLETTPSIELVLMDIMMPEMNGFEAMQEIRKSNARWRSVPIIALTAKAMRDDRQACLEAGANDYVTKPIDVDKLLSLMRIWLNRS